MRLILCVGAFCLLLVPKAFCQNISTSPYSIYGVGILLDRSSALNRDLSGTGIAIHNSYELNHVNSASYAAIQKPVTHITEIGTSIESGNLRTAADRSSYHRGGLTGLSYFFRFSNRWASAIGLVPFSKVDYRVTSTNLTEGSPPVEYRGDGGLTQVFFGNGVVITKNLLVGVNGSLVFGSIKSTERIASGVSTGVSNQSVLSLKRFNVDFGMQYAVTAGENKTFTFGAVYGPNLSLHATRQSTVYQSNGAPVSISDKVNLPDYVLPWHAGAGLSFESVRSLVGADFTFQKMSNAEMGNQNVFADSPVIHLGYEYKGNPIGVQYINSIRIRTGVYFGQEYLRLNQTNLNKWGGTLGFCLPVNSNQGQIAISYGYNHLGTTDKRLIAQQANVITLDFTFRALWGARRKYD